MNLGLSQIDLDVFFCVFTAEQGYLQSRRQAGISSSRGHETSRRDKSDRVRSSSRRSHRDHHRDHSHRQSSGGDLDTSGGHHRERSSGGSSSSSSRRAERHRNSDRNGASSAHTMGGTVASELKCQRTFTVQKHNLN